MAKDFGVPLSITSGLLRVMVLRTGVAKLMTSPDAASAIACRSEPGPLSFVLTTVMLAAKTRNDVMSTIVATTARQVPNVPICFDRELTDPPLVTSVHG